MNYEHVKYWGIAMWLITSLICFVIGYYKTKEFMRWFIIALLCGPLAIIMVITCPQNKQLPNDLKRDD